MDDRTMHDSSHNADRTELLKKALPALEVSWEALEHAGYDPTRLRGSATGVFVGITASDYWGHLRNADPAHLDVYIATGNSHNAAAGRVSFTLGLQGPAIAVDTACSSS